MDLNIIYLSVKSDTPANDYWDMGFINEYLFPQFKYTHTYEVSVIPEVEGGVVVIPARAQYDSIDAINAELAKLKWCVVILTGDEESKFPWRDIKHPQMRVWVMSPKKGEHDTVSFKLGSGYRKEEPEILKNFGLVDRKYDWFFAGQVTHDIREKCAKQLRDLPNGVLLETHTFGSGIEYKEYIEYMAQAKFVPCPAGPVTPDNFRLFEALEAGCIPIADGGDYWSYLFGEPVPFPVLTDWENLPKIMPDLLNNYQHLANKVFSWWQLYKRRTADKLEDDIKEVGGLAIRITDDVTSITPTTSIPSAPQTYIIEEALDSIATQMPDSEIIVCIDGLRPEMSEFKKDYEEYTCRLLYLLKYKYRHAIPIFFEQYSHQSLMTRKALNYIRTPLLLFVEHDTPITRWVDWEKIKEVVKAGYAYQVRLSHEGRIIPEHEYLMLDHAPKMVLGVPLIRTKQWSQRPHLSPTEFYRRIIEKYHDDQPRFIEHVMYGPVFNSDWSEFRCHIYAPKGDMQRSIHLDGRRSKKK